VLDRRLRPGRGPGKLVNAMRYALFGGGKRLRPALVYLGCEAFGGDPRAVDGAAAAVEMIHTYSLVHDDLPCMDDDDLRRGRPTLHVKFDEATAVLAGDALHTEAFATLAELSEASLAPALVRTLAFAAGLEGMVGGQILDLAAEGRRPSAPIVEAIHRGKSAALIAASLEMGAIGARARAADLRRIREYGMIVGLAFQVADDVLDVVGDAATLGKTPGKDAKAGKMTYPAAVGLERSRARARELASRAVRLAESLGGPALPLLVALPTFVTDRSK
jgi:geranylgeranyl pyrophosphate synthase